MEITYEPSRPLDDPRYFSQPVPTPGAGAMPVAVVEPTPPSLDLLELTRDFTGNTTTSSTESIPPNKNRSGAILINDSDTIIYLGLGKPAVLNQGIRLNALGGFYEINSTNLFKGQITRIHGGAGNKVLLATEIETRYASR